MSLSTSLPGNTTAQLRSLLEMEGWPRDYDWSNPELLKMAQSFGQRRLVRILLEKGCVEHVSSSPEVRAAVDGFSWLYAIEQLLNYGVHVNDRNCRGDTALHLAFVVDESSPAVELLMKTFLPAATENLSNCDRLSLLHIACAKSTLDAARDFLDRFLCDIDCQVSLAVDSPYAGYTPLHFAVHHGNFEVATLLLQHDAGFYEQDRNGSTALHLALDRGDTRMIDLILLNDHLHENCSNNCGLTHFMAACAGSVTSVVDEFLRVAETVRRVSASSLVVARVADNHHRFAGYAPLHFAARCGNLRMVQLLLERGASCFATTRDGATALDIARAMGFEKICQLLERFGDGGQDALLVSWMESMTV